MKNILEYIKKLFTDSSRTNKQLPRYDKKQSVTHKTIIRNKTLNQNNWGGWSTPISIGKIGPRTPRDIANDCWNIILPDHKDIKLNINKSKRPKGFASGGIVPKDKIKQSPFIEHEIIIHPEHIKYMMNILEIKDGPRYCLHDMIEITSRGDIYPSYMCSKCGLQPNKDSNKTPD